MNEDPPQLEQKEWRAIVEVTIKGNELGKLALDALPALWVGPPVWFQSSCANKNTGTLQRYSQSAADPQSHPVFTSECCLLGSPIPIAGNHKILNSSVWLCLKVRYSGRTSYDIRE